MKKQLSTLTQKVISGRRGRDIWNAAKYYAVGLFDHLDEDHAFMLASGIAFNVLFSIIPLSLLLFDLFTVILRDNARASQIIIDYVAQSIPVPAYRDTAVEWLSTQLTSIKHIGHVAGFIGGLTLMWLASALFSSLRTTVNA